MLSRRLASSSGSLQCLCLTDYDLDYLEWPSVDVFSIIFRRYSSYQLEVQCRMSKYLSATHGLIPALAAVPDQDLEKSEPG